MLKLIVLYGCLDENAWHFCWSSTATSLRKGGYLQITRIPKDMLFTCTLPQLAHICFIFLSHSQYITLTNSSYTILRIHPVSGLLLKDLETPRRGRRERRWPEELLSLQDDFMKHNMCPRFFCNSVAAGEKVDWTLSGLFCVLDTWVAMPERLCPSNLLQQHSYCSL